MMKIVDAIAEILKREGVSFLSAYPTTSVIDATAAVGIRSVLCRQERVGVGIADGFTRITNGRRPGVFAMQYGPGAENAFAGVAAAARALVEAQRPVIHAGQGVMYAEASGELRELAELLTAPVMTTLEGKSAFDESHPLALGTGSSVMSRPVYQFLKDADLVFGIGCSFTKHGMATNIPAGKRIIHATNDERDLNKNYAADHPILGDAKLVLRQLIDAVKDLGNVRKRADVAGEIEKVRAAWLQEWMPKLTSNETPISPYRVIWDFMNTIDARDAIVTHDSGSPREQLIPFYRATAPRSYIGWGKSHALAPGPGLTIGPSPPPPPRSALN